MSQLAIDNLVVRYGAVDAVDHVSFEVAEGSLTAVVGPSGCGKTSLLRAIAGFEVPARGTIHLAGELVAGPKRWVAPEKRRVGMVFQQGALFPHLTVLDNVRYGLRGKNVKAHARAVLELVGLPHHGDRFPDELSGGEQQRIALARALAPAPRLVLLDEPFSSLDANLRRRLRDEVREVLRQAEATALLVTHDLEEALSIADTVIVMMGGKVLQAGSPAMIYHRPASLDVARFIGDGQLVRCNVARGRARSLLGEVSAAGPVTIGDGVLLVRPEDIEFCVNGVAGRPGTAKEEVFYGHDRIQPVELDGGGLLHLRLLSTACLPKAESKVRVRLRPAGSYRVFPDPADFEPPITLLQPSGLGSSGVRPIEPAPALTLPLP
ncbi:MAG: ABC transporter ATP-binding protein [Acidobacteriota bacterium]